MSKPESTLEDGKYFGEKLSCKGEREHQEVGSTNRVVEEDLSESLGRDLEVRRQIKPRR